MTFNRMTLAVVAIAGGGLLAATLGVSAAATPVNAGSLSSPVAISTAGVIRSTGPRISWDWTMPSNIIDRKGWDFAGQKLSGPPDGIPDSRMKPMTTYRGTDYLPAGRGQYGTIPVDGRHKVVLDASGTTGRGKVRCTWHINSKPRVTIKNVRCAKKQSVLLPEGTFGIRLEARDKSGTTKIRSRITVRNTLIALMGDSYSSGVGFAPYRVDGITGPNSEIAWDDDTGCYRSRWAGFVRAALAVEKADPRSNVTLVDVACGGAQVEADPSGAGGGGILTPEKARDTIRPAQVDQLTSIIGKRSIDVVLLSIGGNDSGFGPIYKHCMLLLLGGADRCYDSDRDGMPLWRWVDDRMVGLDREYADMAPCLSRSAPGACRTAKTLTGPLTPATALPVVDPSRVIQSAYPNLTTRVKKSGEVGNGSASWLQCSFKPNSSQPDAAGTYNQAPLMPWDGDYAVRAIYEGQPGDSFTPTDAPSPATKVGPLRGSGINELLRKNARRYGYSLTMDMFDQSKDHGPCAVAPGMTYWVNGMGTAFGGAPQDQAKFLGGILHPSEIGQQKYAQFLTEPAKRVARIPVRRAADRAVPGPVRKIQLTDVSRSWKVGEGRLKVTWKRPSNSMGGASVDKYRVRLSKADRPNKWQRWHQVDERRKVFKNLNKNKRYRVSIKAHNAAGWGEANVRRVPRDLWAMGRG